MGEDERGLAARVRRVSVSYFHGRARGISGFGEFTAMAFGSASVRGRERGGPFLCSRWGEIWFLGTAEFSGFRNLEFTVCNL